MKTPGARRAYVFGIWAGIAMRAGAGSAARLRALRGFAPERDRGDHGHGGRGILAMLVDTMIPEAFEPAHDFAGWDGGGLSGGLRADQAGRLIAAERRG